MKKKLVEVSNMDAYICLDSKKFYAEDNMVLTPGVKDELSKRGIAIVHSSKPETVYSRCSANAHAAGAHAQAAPQADNLEDLLVSVAALVREEFGIEDPETLKAVSCQVVKTLKENI